MTDEEALLAADEVLAIDIKNPNPTQLKIIDLCLWVKAVSKRLPKPKRTRNEYMRDYMKVYRAKRK